MGRTDGQGISLLSGAYLDARGRDVCSECGKVAYVTGAEAQRAGAKHGLVG